MSGFETDLAGIGVTAAVLADTADSLTTTVDGLTGGGTLGPGRLDQATAALIAATREQLTGLLAEVTAEAAMLASVRADYTAADEDARAALRRVDPW
ncbi:hypothetical protein [Actinophytocola sediminis]